MALLLLLLSIIPQPDNGVLSETVDLIEVNHHYRADATLLHEQLIFWDWHYNVVIPATEDEYDACREKVIKFGQPEWKGARFMCVDWRLYRGPHMRPERDWRHGGYVVRFQERNGQAREVRCLSIRETWTQNIPDDTDKTGDPESYEREFVMPREKRRGLKKAPETKPFVHETPAETPDAH